MNTIDKIKEVIDVLYETFRLPSIYMDLERKVIYQHKEFEATMLDLFDFREDNTLPQIRTTSHYQNYIGIPVTKEYVKQGMILIGPSISTAITEEILKQSMKTLSINKRRELVAYYQGFPIISFDQLNHIASLAYYMVYGTRVQVEEIIEYNFYKVQAAMLAERKLDKILSLRRQNEMHHHSYEAEKQILDCIKRGETEKLLKILKQPCIGEIGILAKDDPIRSMKNGVIILTGLASRTMIRASIPYEVAYALNDAYVQLIEESVTPENIKSLMVTMLCDCSELVNDFNKNAYSKVVKRCLNYVYSHLYEEISVKEMSRELHFNQNYISRIFKEEVGKTISEFINSERIEEAKKLLEYTEYSIMDIVTFLHFHDQSHFTRVFRRFTGCTPKKYRDQFCLVKNS